MREIYQVTLREHHEPPTTPHYRPHLEANQFFSNIFSFFGTMASSSKVIVDTSEEEEEEEVYEVEKLMGHRRSILNKVNKCTQTHATTQKYLDKLTHTLVH